MFNLKNSLSFFDKIINVTFYGWKLDPETKVQTLEAACAIRSDRPGKGFRYFENVRSPAYESDVEDTKKGIDDITKKLFEFGSNLVKIDRYDMKPDIRLQMTQLPETVCTQITVTIENMTLELDIEKYNMMLVEAGYAYSNGDVDLTTKLQCSIFSSYIETPNPSGRTVFTGIVGNWFTKGLRAQPYTVSFANGSYLLRDYITVICSYLGVIPKISLPPACLVYPIVVQDKAGEVAARAQSGYQVLDWLATELNALTKEWRDARLISPNDLIIATFYNNFLFVNLANTAREEDRDKAAINLNRISSATYQGGVLWVTAPWNPLLTPGQLFHMNSTFFRGRLFPNVAAKEIQDKNNLYRPISIEVTFETNGPGNQMKIRAVAAHVDAWNPNEGLTTTGPGKEALKGQYKDPKGVIKEIGYEQYREALATAGNAEAYDRATAAFYPREGNPYAVGVLMNHEEEVKLRTKASKAFQKAKNSNDLYIRVDDDVISRWKKILQEQDLQNAGGAGVGVIQYKYLETDDPARNSTYRNKVGSSLLEIPFVNQTRARQLQGAYSFSHGTYDYMVAGGALGRGVFTISKHPVSTDPIPHQQVSIMSLVKPLAALYSCSKADEKENKVWWGNVFSMVPVMDDRTNEQLRILFPEANFNSNYKSFVVPMIGSSGDLKTLLSTHKDYLHAVLDYWKAMSRIGQEAAGKPVPYDDSVSVLLRWHEDFPSTPWFAWDKAGTFLENW